MGVLANLAAQLFPDYNADGSPYGPPVANIRALAAAADNAIPNAQDLAGEIQRAEIAETAEAEARSAADGVEAAARRDGDAAEANRAQQAEGALGGRIDDEASARQDLSRTLQGEIGVVQRGLDAANAAVAPLLQADVPDALQAQAASLAGLGGRADGVDRAVALLQQDGASLRGLVGPRLDALSTALGTAALASRDRVGDNPFLFTPSLAGLGPACPPLPGDGIVGGPYGLAYRVTGAFTVARRAPLWLEPGRVFALRFAYARVSRPADPDDDTIRCGVACLDGAGRLLGVLVIDDAASVSPTDGLQVVTARFPSQPDDALDLAPPAGTVLFRPYLATFGLDGVTDLVLSAESDITDSGSFSPDLSSLQNQVTAIRTALAQASPLAAGTPGGLATIDPASGNVQQLPMLRAAWLLTAEQIVPGANAMLDQGVAIQNDATLTILHRSPYVVPGDAWSTFAEATLGLSDAQVAGILAAIGSPAQRAGTLRPNPVFDLGVTTSHVLEAALARFGGIAGASMKAFRNGIGDEDDPNFYVFWSERSAPVGGALYGLLLAYLVTAAPSGPGLSQQAAIAQLTAIWDAAASIAS